MSDKNIRSELSLTADPTQQARQNLTNKIYDSVEAEIRWMDELVFYVPSTVFQSFRDNGRVNMKGSVQWSAV